MYLSKREKNSIADTACLVVDTREKQTQALQERIKNGGWQKFRRQKLLVGDYAVEYTLPNGCRHVPRAVVERKYSLDEMAACCGVDRIRFLQELDRSAECGVRVYVLIENSSWEDILEGKYRSKISPESFAGTLMMLQARYGAVVLFCKEHETGRLIRGILRSEIKEALNRL